MQSSYSSDILMSMKQTATPLNTLYFSEYNINLLHRAIRQKFKNMTGKSIDYQSQADLIAIMRYIYLMNLTDPYGNIHKQVQLMNTRVIDTAMSQLMTSVSQFYGYAKDISNPIVPPNLPTNTSLHGTKIGTNRTS